jgi:4,5-DOPA dioxygenase extradiol
MSAARLPFVFVAHSTPALALDAAKGAPLRAWGASMPEPRSIVAISPNWVTRDPTLGTTRSRPLLYDFTGYSALPAEVTKVEYPYKPALHAAARVEETLRPKWSVSRSDDRKIDPCIWAPLVHLYPQADVPLVQLSLPRRDPEELFELGRQLAPLADEGVLLMTTGGLVHNLRRAQIGSTAPPPAWAVEFDRWCEDVLTRCDFAALVQFRVRAPKLAMAHPTEDHFAPLVIAAGAASTRANVKVTFPVTGFEHGSISRRCVQLG